MPTILSRLLSSTFPIELSQENNPARNNERQETETEQRPEKKSNKGGKISIIVLARSERFTSISMYNVSEVGDPSNLLDGTE